MTTTYRTADPATPDTLRQYLDGATTRRLAHNTWAEADHDGSAGVRSTPPAS